MRRYAGGWDEWVRVETLNYNAVGRNPPKFHGAHKLKYLYRCVFGICTVQDNTQRRFDWTSGVVPYPVCLRIEGSMTLMSAMSVADFNAIARKFRVCGSHDLPDSRVNEAVKHLFGLWQTQTLTLANTTSDAGAV